MEPVSGGGQTSPPATSAPPGTTSPSGQPSASAADQLAGFFSAAQAADARLHHAAALANAGIGAKTIHLSPSTVAAVKALDLTAVEHAIPAGLPSELQRQVMLVYSDLVSRTWAFNRYLMYRSRTTLPASGTEGRDLVRCLGNGAPAAARYDADLAAARAYAQTVPPLTVAAPDSRAAAEVLLRVDLIKIANGGCGSCGGRVFTQLPTVVWQRQTEPGFGYSDGYVNHVRFSAHYRAGHGWDVVLFAC